MAQPPRSTSRRPPTPASADDMAIAARQHFRDTMRRRQYDLSKFRRMAASDPPMDRVVADALELARQTLQTDRCAYAVRGVDGQGFRLTAGIGWDPGIIGRDSLSGLPGSLGAHTTLVGRSVIVEDLRLVPAFSVEPLMVTSGTRSTLTVPVRGQRGTSGLLGAFSSRRRLYSLEEAEFLLGVADVIAAALYREDWKRRMTRPQMQDGFSPPADPSGCSADPANDRASPPGVGRGSR
jgi:signal transduction protein with GAF and PtsI domain